MHAGVNNQPGSPQPNELNEFQSEEGKESGCTLPLMGCGCVCHHAPACSRVAHSPFRKMGGFYRFQKHCMKCRFWREPGAFCWDPAKFPDTPFLSPVPAGGLVFRSSVPASSCEAGRQLVMLSSREPQAVEELSDEGEKASKAEKNGTGGWRSGPGGAALLRWQEADAPDQCENLRKDPQAFMERERGALMQHGKGPRLHCCLLAQMYEVPNPQLAQD